MQKIPWWLSQGGQCKNKQYQNNVMKLSSFK